MDPSWNELKNQLKEGPFSQSGFNKQLQWKIEEKLEKKATYNKARLFTIVSSCTVILLIALAIRLNWSPLFNSVASMEKNADQVIELKSSEEAKPNAANLQAPVKSVLLIGFRTDYQDNTGNEQSLKPINSSEYRSLMITGDTENPGKLTVAAEGSNILMPYGQQFWTIDSVTQEAADHTFQYLNAFPATESGLQEKSAFNSPEGINHSEKLVYVGNQYVSIVGRDQEKLMNMNTIKEDVWIHKVNQMNTPEYLNFNPISLEQILAKQEGKATTDKAENWTITRSKGLWIPQIADAQKINNEATTFRLHSFADTLPEGVISYDKLSSTWEQIIQVQPTAIDAISSPDGDMIAILTLDKLYAYPYVDHEIGPLALQINLNPNETLIMAQWATAQYAEFWIESGKKYLKK
jgi:hypothetical protein